MDESLKLKAVEHARTTLEMLCNVRGRALNSMLKCPSTEDRNT